MLEWEGVKSVKIVNKRNTRSATVINLIRWLKIYPSKQLLHFMVNRKVWDSLWVSGCVGSVGRHPAGPLQTSCV